MARFQTPDRDTEQFSGAPRWLPLVAGLLIGLLLGLLIGWVIWPVQWTGGALSDLEAGTRADYLAAVADSYVALQSPEAAQTALRRLAPIQTDLANEFQGAIDHFRLNPTVDSEARVVNLVMLANALGIGLGTQAAAPQSAQVAVQSGAQGEQVVGTVPMNDSASQSTQSNASVAGTLATQNEGGGWLSWLLTLLGAVLLIGGGLYLFRRVQPMLAESGASWRTGLNRRAGEEEDESGGSFDDEQDFSNYPEGAARASGWVRPSESASSTVGQGVRPSVRDAAYEPRTRRAYSQAEEEPDFPASALEEEDDLDWKGEKRRPADQAPLSLDEEAEFGEEDEEEAQPYQPGNHASSVLHQPVRDFGRTDEEVQDDDKNLFKRRRREETPFDEPSPRSAAQNAPPSARHRSLDETSAPRYEPRTPSTKTGDAPLPRVSGAKSLGSFECTYSAGVDEYDESYPVIEAGTARYIGECGMGVSTKNRILHKNPEEVIALEVWLFDKTDERNISDQMRVLMSEFASDHYADAFLKDRNGASSPFVAQLGVRFQLEGRNLVLNGEVADVSYTREGIFQYVKVRMDVLRR